MFVRRVESLPLEDAAETWDLFELVVLIKCGTWWCPHWVIPHFNLPHKASDTWLVDFLFLFLIYEFMPSLLASTTMPGACTLCSNPPAPSFLPHCSTTLFHPDATGTKDIPKLGHDLPGNSTTQRGCVVHGFVWGQSLQPSVHLLRGCRTFLKCN